MANAIKICPKCGSKMKKKMIDITSAPSVSGECNLPGDSGVAHPYSLSGTDFGKRNNNYYYECTNEECGYTEFI